MKRLFKVGVITSFSRKAIIWVPHISIYAYDLKQARKKIKKSSDLKNLKNPRLITWRNNEY